MSDDGENATTQEYYDYSGYYDGFPPVFAPCNVADLKNFGEVFLPTLYSLVFILGFLGNGLVVCVLVYYRNQTNLTDICLFNLAISDLLFVLTLPFYAHYSVVGQWTLGDFMCRFAAGSHKTGFFSSIFFMVVMTLDRYMVILHTRSMARYRTLRAGVAVSLLVWMLSLCVSLPDIIYTKVTNESHGLACSYVPENDSWKIYNIFSINVLGLVIPLLVMVICYTRIIPILVNIRSAKKHRVIKLIITIVVAFFLFWAPYNIILFLGFLKSEGVLQSSCNIEGNLRLSAIVTETFAYTHCCLNPIIYAFVGQKFMKRALQLLRKWVPVINFTFPRDFSDSSYRKSSVVSRSSDATSTFIM
ncbi:C-C chemokine receptor type 1-like [Epinephelus fuscoguttatus]|uniref:C-C chemokine receptor type 1-like n=1 Tax=Epinephelus fuscoguttatus TaxID=293821 RepID=UPI0020D11255|nr:C-C chemokine receptor type 1-like [Epinephelus fuscoguttatus]XP_049439017.1 C-C chemokine receptor type 1-like [Epinephelus fuscoguttatus]